MLKEQLLGFAMKALSQAYETKEIIKENLKGKTVQTYVRTFKDAAVWMVETQWQKFAGEVREQRRGSSKYRVEKSTGGNKSKIVVKKERKSSIKPAKEIGSQKAGQILEMLKKDGSRLVKKNDMLESKKSLAYLVWALGHAERANLADGISVHDVSSLLYQSCKIELYPINVSRVVYGNTSLIKQVGQEKRTKTYLLTPQGQALFKEKFLQD